MPSGVSIDSRLKILERNAKRKDNVSHMDKLKIDYLFSQVQFGFGDDRTLEEIAQWTRVLGAKRIEELQEEQKEKERLAKEKKQFSYSWKGLVEND